MRRIVLYGLLAFAAVSNRLWAQSQFIVNDDGIGARGIAMAGANVALSSDYSAIYWNPAGLTNIRQHELGLSLSYLSLKDVSSYDNGPDYTGTSTDLKLQSIGFVYPFATSQGSLVMALGYSRPTSLNYVYRDDLSLYEEKGYESRWEGAVGVDLSPKISLGTALFLNSGKDETERNFNTAVLYYGDTVNRVSDIGSLFGLGFNLGVLYKPSEAFRLGVSADLYGSLNTKRNAENILDEKVVSVRSESFTLVKPLKIRGGAGYQTVPFSLELDLTYTDWQGARKYLEGSGTPFYLNSPGNPLNNTVDVSVGAEFLLPLPASVSPGIKFRLGYARYQIPNADYQSANGKNEFAGGFGILLDKALLIEMAMKYTLMDAKYEDAGLIQESVAAKKAFLTLSYRY